MAVSRIWFTVGALAGGLAVAAAAYSAHAPVEPARARALASAVEMQGWHALALLGVGLLGRGAGLAGHLAGGLFAAGLLLFCGAVYVPLFGGPGLGLVAPVGGTMLMAGWLALAVAGLRVRASP